MNEKKKIFLRGFYNLFNFGDDLLLISNIEFLNKELKFTNENLNIYISKNGESLQKLKFKSPLELKQSIELSDVIYRINLKLKQFDIPIEFPSIHELIRNIIGANSTKARISSVFLLIFLLIIIFIDIGLYAVFRKALFTKEYLIFLKNLDLIHYIGGGYFTDRWLDTLIYECITVVLAKTLNPGLKVIGTGLGIGPFKNKINLIVLKAFIKNFEFLFVRETESLSLIEDLKVNVYNKVLGDDVILLLPYLARLKSERHLNDNNITALNLKCFPDHDYSLLKHRLENYIKFLQEKNYKIEYFCFGRKPGPDDLSLIEIFDNDYKSNLVIHDPYDEGWISFLENLAKANIGVGFAYHFNVILTLLGIPVISVYSGEYYRQKIAGVIKLLSNDSVVLSIDELALKNLVEVLDKAKNSKPRQVEDGIENLYKNMKLEYLRAYESVLNKI
jgi:polysaccharide pyruvyl transferase WcaK-like protein